MTISHLCQPENRRNRKVRLLGTFSLENGDSCENPKMD